MKIHRAIKSCPIRNETYLYHIGYTGEGFNIKVDYITIHLIGEDGIIGPDIVPPDRVNDAILAGVNILFVDGVTELTDEEEGIEGIFEGS